MNIYPSELHKELLSRWQRVQELVALADADGVLVSDNTNICYLSDRVFGGFVYLPVDSEPLFFVRRPSGLDGDNVVYIRKVEDILLKLQERGYALPKRLIVEGDTATYNECSRFIKAFEGIDLLFSGTQILRRARSRKTDYEIEQARRSGEIHDRLYAMIPSLYRSGMSDIDLAIEIEYQSRKLGSLGSVRIFGSSMEIFMGNVLVGANADTPSPYDFALGGGGMDSSLPISTNGTLITEGTTTMIDVGGNFTRYMTDMSRVFSLGAISDKALRAHELALQMQSAMEQMVSPGTPTADVYNMCRDMAEQAGLGDCFMGHRQQAGFVGHGVGLEVNEVPVMAPRSRELFEQGTLFAFEPKFVIEEVGAVGVENTFVVTDSGVEKLTHTPEEITPLA